MLVEEYLMNCLDCAVEKRARIAVGVCAICNAGVCLRCVRLDTHALTIASSPGRTQNRATRQVLCPECAQVVATMHTVTFTGAGAIPPLRQASDV
jgi:hypothetical protein